MGWLNKSERRKYCRLRAPHLFKYRVLKRKEVLNPASFIRDVSAGGARFFSEEYIPPESIVELKIKFPMFAEPLPVLSRVVRVRPRANGFEIGKEFTDLNEDIRNSIDQKIREVYNLKRQKEGGISMRGIGMIFVILAALSTIVAITLRVRAGFSVPLQPAVWLQVSHTCLFFAIAFSLLAKRED